MRAIYRTSGGDFFIAESVEHAAEMAEEWEVSTGASLSDSVAPFASDEFTLHYESMIDVPEHLKALASKTAYGYSITRPVSDWAAEGVGYLCSEDY